MKIGAGALQSMLVQDAMPQRSPADAQARASQSMNQEMGMAGASVNRRELIKSLERLNKNAKLYKLNDEFLLMEEDDEIYVAVVDKYTGAVKRKLPPERFLSGQNQNHSGVMLDSQG